MFGLLFGLLKESPLKTHWKTIEHVDKTTKTALTVSLHRADRNHLSKTLHTQQTQIRHGPWLRNLIPSKQMTFIHFPIAQTLPYYLFVCLIVPSFTYKVKNGICWRVFNKHTFCIKMFAFNYANTSLHK